MGVSGFPRDRERELRIIFGRNYFETLLLTVRWLELNNPRVDVRENVARIVEEEICSYGAAFPVVRDIYVRNIYNIIESEFPDAPRPSLKGCRVFDQVLEWAMDNKEVIRRKLPRNIYTGTEVSELIRYVCAWVVRTAQQATFFRISAVSKSPSAAVFPTI